MMTNVVSIRERTISCHIVTRMKEESDGQTTSISAEKEEDDDDDGGRDGNFLPDLIDSHWGLLPSCSYIYV